MTTQPSPNSSYSSVTGYFLRAGAIAAAVLAGAGCAPAPSGPQSLRVVDAFDATAIEGSIPGDAVALPRTEWKFDGPAPPRPAAPAPPGPPPPFAATRGWEAGPGVADLEIRDGALRGRTTSAIPILHVERTSGLDNPDQVYAFEIRMSASAGANLSIQHRPAPTVDLAVELGQLNAVPWTATSPLIASDGGGGMQTYTITPPAPISLSRVRHLLVRPTDAAGAEFAIESLRLVSRREYLASVPSGVGWQGLRDVFRETIVTRPPESFRFRAKLPARPLLDLSLGTPDDEPVTFEVAVDRAGKAEPLLTHSVTTPHRWERRQVDLGRFAGEEVTLRFTARAEKPGSLAFWGAPVVRQRVAGPGGPPQIVLLVQGDTLRKDHLDVYGYERQTAPTLTRLAAEGALFQHAITQTSWTKAATPSIMTSLYPSTHGVHKIPDRLPASAETIAEIYRRAGYATLSFSSVAFTGKLTNLHQGFEELHESESTVGRAGPKGSKTSREYVDRFLEWLDGHRDVPVFAYLHFFDPHGPYEPNRPWDTFFADPAGREVYQRHLETLKKTVADPFLAQRGMATPEELRQAGIDPAEFIRFSKDWYDGSIRGMDREIARLVERLQELGLAERTVIAFYADHGEEFHDHGRMWHGEGVYGEMLRVPLILWGPGRVPAGRSIEQPVSLIDMMPTLLDWSGLESPAPMQGRSMRRLIEGLDRKGGDVAAGMGWQPGPVIAEKQPMGANTFPRASESYAIIDGDWKLIWNVQRAPETAEFELFEFYRDPLDQKNVAADHPEEVARLAKALEGWRRIAAAAKLKSDAEIAEGMTAEQLEQLRSLGYLK